MEPNGNSGQRAPAPVATTRLTRRQSRQLAQNEVDLTKAPDEGNVRNDTEPKSVDADAIDLSFNDTSSVVSGSSFHGKQKKTPSRRKLRRADPTQCLDIISPMYAIFYEQEEKFLIETYMPNQKDINYRMRSILVDWLVEVHYKFRLQHPTLWLCINLMDRYLEEKALVRNKLQLLGVACLLIACKFEEIYPPEVRDCVYITDNAYTRAEVLQMEQSVLLTLDYQLCVPTGYHFVSRYLTLINASERLRHLAFYYAERNLQESVMFSHKPSHLASAALYAALFHQSQYSDSAVNRSASSEFYSDDDEPPVSRVWPDLLVDETGEGGDGGGEHCNGS